MSKTLYTRAAAHNVAALHRLEQLESGVPVSLGCAPPCSPRSQPDPRPRLRELQVATRTVKFAGSRNPDCVAPRAKEQSRLHHEVLAPCTMSVDRSQGKRRADVQHRNSRTEKRKRVITLQME